MDNNLNFARKSVFKDFSWGDDLSKTVDEMVDELIEKTGDRNRVFESIGISESDYPTLKLNKNHLRNTLQFYIKEKGNE